MKRRRIDLLAPPFSGHLNPVLAMARLLNEKYDVRVLSTDAARAVIADAGVTGKTILSGWDNRLQLVVNPPYAVGSNPFRLHRQFSAALELLMQLRSEVSSLYLNDRPDLIIADFTLATIGAVAEEMNIPWWTSLPSPCVLEATNGTPAYLGGWKPPTNIFGRLRDYAGRVCIKYFKHTIALIYSRSIAKTGLAQIYRDDGTEAIYSKECILLLGMQEIEFTKKWPAAATFIGPLLYTPTNPTIAPPFVHGRKHLLVTMGTHLSWIKEHIVTELINVAKKIPHVEIHFTDGNLHGGSAKTTANFSRLSFIDYGKHLHKYEAVLHHGGSGIMYHCIKEARKSIVYPIDYDQFDNAARLEQAGIAYKIRSLDNLESQILKVFEDVEMARNCEKYALSMFASPPEDVFIEKIASTFN